MAKAKEEVIRLEKIDPKTMVVTIEGDGELVCNKMNDVTVKNLTDQRNDKAKKVTEKPNKWEEIITAIHWKNGKPEEFSEESLLKQLDPSVNQPCFTAFGFGKMLGQAVVRYGYDTYATKFNAAVNIVADGGLIPFTFTEYHLDEKLMSPKKGSPVLARLSRFSGWRAEIKINFVDTIYSAEQIINIINLAGFGLGIGSGRTSGYGRFHVTAVR